MVKIPNKEPISRIRETSRTDRVKAKSESSTNAQLNRLKAREKYSFPNDAIKRVLLKSTSTKEGVDEAIQLIISHNPIFKELSSDKLKQLIEAVVNDVGNNSEIITYVDKLKKSLRD